MVVRRGEQEDSLSLLLHVLQVFIFLSVNCLHSYVETLFFSYLLLCLPINDSAYKTMHTHSSFINIAKIMEKNQFDWKMFATHTRAKTQTICGGIHLFTILCV